MSAEEIPGLEHAPRNSVLRRTTAVLAVLVLCALVAACGPGSDGGASGSGSSAGGSKGNIEGGIRVDVTVGNAVITVNALQAAFQPVAPPQRLSDEALVAPASGVTFYQAYVRVKNTGTYPLRVDPEDFVCRIGNTLSMIEPPRSGPVARSIIRGTSLDLVLTFRGAAGADPVLLYSPPWYSGVISFSAGVQTQGATTTVPMQTLPTAGSSTIVQ